MKQWQQVSSNDCPQSRRLVVDSEGQLIAECYGPSLTETIANARLIAAAPKLLAAAKVMAVNFAQDHRNCESFDDYRTLIAAIREAEGEEPEPKDETDIICPTCQDPDCNRPFGHSRE